jgi:hypothetical protein
MGCPVADESGKDVTILDAQGYLKDGVDGIIS